MKTKTLFVLIISIITLIGAGCGKQDPSLNRPKLESKLDKKEVDSEQAPNTEIPENYNTEITVADKKLLVEVANTPTARQQGLSFRKLLSDNNGMLFDFGGAPQSLPGFWMKDMNFNIDIIWINNGKIIGVAKNASVPQPNTPTHELQIYSPPGSVTHVLEVRAQWYDDNQIKIGDSVKI